MIANIFIKRPLTAIVISIVIVLIGLISIYNLPISQYPDISPPTVQISGLFNGTPGMAYMQSNSTSDGRSTINVYLNVGTDPNIAALDIQNRVGIATPLLPDDVKRLGLTTRKRSPSILLLVAMFSPNDTHGIQFLDNYTNIFVRFLNILFLQTVD